MKKLLILVCIILALNPVSVNATTANDGYITPVDVVINGARLKTCGFLDNGSTYVPVRAFAESMGAQVEWKNHQTTITRENVSFVLSSENSVNCEGQLYAPISVFKANFEFETLWDAVLLKVSVTDEASVVPHNYRYTSISDDEILNLARIIQLEAHGESLKCQIAIGNVILNRVVSNKFPDTVTEVIFQPNQFPPVTKFKMDFVPLQSSIVAAKLALMGVNEADGALFFVSASAASSWVGLNRPFIKRLDNTMFYS